MIPDFTACLRRELMRRRRANPRYSLRAFARFLGMDHSTLSQVLRGKRELAPSQMPDLARRLRIGPEEASVYLAARAFPDAAGFEARGHTLSWLREAQELMASPEHWQLLSLIQDADWRPDMRWAAARLEVSVDALNMALSRLLRLGLLRVDGSGAWRLAPELHGRDHQGMRELALARIRGCSAA